MRAFLRFLLKLIFGEGLIAIFTWQGVRISPVAIPIGLLLGGILLWWLLKKERLIGNRIFGIITETKCITHGADRTGGIVKYAVDMMQKNFLVLTVTSPNGTEKTLELDACCEKVFCKGDAIIRMAGMQHPIKLFPTHYSLCPLCGNVAPKEAAICTACGKPIPDLTACNAEKQKIG